MQISVSRLRAYQSCSQRYFFRYVANEAPEFVPANLTFGSAIHHAICQYHQSRNTIGSNGMYREFMRYWKAITDDSKATQQPIRYGKHSEDDLLEKAYQLCVEYVGQFQEVVPNSPLDVEIFFDVPLFEPQGGFGSLEHSLSGKIDLVANGSIYEFKTASRTPSQSEADASIQLSAYAMAYAYLYDKPPDNLYLVALVKTSKPKVVTLSTRRWYKDYHVLVDMGMSVARAVEASLFYRNRETQWGCHTCEYEGKCLGFQPHKEGSKQ
jgi:hypothetical protein